MSQPISSLKKTKKPPLFFPEMITSPTPNINQSIDFQNQSKPSTQRSLVDTKSHLSAFNLSYLNRPSINKSPDPRRSVASNSNNSDRKSSLGTPLKLTHDEDDLIDEVTTKLAQNNFKKHTYVPRLSNDALKNTPSDMDLMQMMMQKLKVYEAKCMKYEQEVKEKDKRIRVLEEKASLYEKASEKNSNSYLVDLECKYYLLQEKVQQMEKFFTDYGLVWVGENEKNTEEKEEAKSSARETNDAATGFECNYDLIIRNVKELNELVYESEQKIVQNSSARAMFKSSVSDNIRFVLYKNGISLFNGPFRPFTDMKTQRFCIDIMDGYFPSELQEKYPDGVPFELFDQREKIFEDKLTKVLESKGYRLGDSIDEENRDNIVTQLTDTKLTLNQFLNKLPNCVIKNGNIINVRNEISDRLKGVDETLKPIPESDSITHEVIKESEIEAIEIDDSPKSMTNEAEIIALKIKAQNNESILIKVSPKITISELKSKVKAKKKNIRGEFDLATIFPNKKFTDDRLSLKDYEITQNTNLVLIPRRK